MVGNSDGPHGLNDLNIGGVRYLIVGISTSHLAGLAEGDVRGRHALAEWRTGTEAWAASYDLDALFGPTWNPRTLCGREWIEMEPGDGPPFDDGRVGVYAPSCKNCLRIVSHDLEGVAPDERIPLIVGLVVTEVLAEAGTVPRGFHGPAAAAPQHHMYYLNVMAGPSPQREWRFCDDPAHAWACEALEQLPRDPRLPMTSAQTARSPS